MTITHFASLVAICCAGALSASRLAAAEAGPYRPPETVPETGIGIHYDGSQVVPDEKPPLSFDQKTGKNIRWKVELPQWGLAGLVPVGNRVLHLADTDVRYIWPVLRCYDSKSGALAWERELNPFDALPKVSKREREEVAASLTRMWEDHRVAYRALRAVCAGKADQAVKEKELAARGITLKHWKYPGLHRNVEWSKERDQLRKSLWDKYNIQSEMAITGQGRTGDAFGTPVTDGEHVYAITIHGHVAAVRMADGKVTWTRSLAEMQAPKYRMANHFMTSPRLYGNVLLALWGDTNKKFADVLVALDKRTGKELWHLEVKYCNNNLGGQWKSDEKHAFNGRPGGSPRILVVDDEPIVLIGAGLFVRLRDGKPYKAGVLPNVQNYTIDPTSNSIFGSVSLDGPGSHFGARLRHDGDALAFESLFYWPRAGFGSNWGSHGIWHEGRLYWAGHPVDPATGIPQTMKPTPALGDTQAFKKQWWHLKRSKPVYRFGTMFTLLVNDHIYGLKLEKMGRDKHAQRCGVLHVTTLDGKRVASSKLVQDEATPQHLLDQGWPTKDHFSYNGPMAIGNDCIYIASDQFLYCIGR